MKKMLLVVFLLGCFVGVSKATTSGSASVIGDYKEKPTVSDYALVVTTAVAVNVPAVNFGVQRIITNNSTGNLYFSYSNVGISSANVIYSKEHYIEDRFFGIIYVQGEAGSASADVRVSVVNW